MKAIIGDNKDLIDYNYSNFVSSICPNKVKYANGFLKAKIENWFPSINEQWEGFFINLNINFVFHNIRASIIFNDNQVDPKVTSILEFGENRVGLEFQDSLNEKIEKALAYSSDSNVFLDYLSRRILNSFRLAWSGSKQSESQFLPKEEALKLNCNWMAKIEFNFKLNGVEERLNFYLEKELTDTLHTLWLKQLRSRSTQTLRAGQIGFEIANKFIESSELAKSLKIGSTISVDKKVDNKANLLYEGRPWLPAELFECEGKFVAKILSGSPKVTKNTGSLVRLSFEISNLDIDPITALEVNQRGAFIKSEIEVKNIVSLKVNKEEVGKAQVFIDNGNYLFQII